MCNAPCKACAVLITSRFGAYRTWSPILHYYNLYQAKWASKLTVFLVAAVDVEVDVTLPRMVGRVQIRELGEERPRILGERMKKSKVDTSGRNLKCPALAMLARTHERMPYKKTGKA